MPEIEPGHQVTHSFTNHGERQSPAPLQTSAGPSQVALSFTSGLGLLRLLRDTRDPDARSQLEALALGHIAATRDRSVKALLPLVSEWLRSSRNTGAEGLFLSLLSAVRSLQPESWEPTLALASTLAWSTDFGGAQLFLDLSIPHRAIASLVPSHRLAKLLEAITAADPSMVDVGQIVRGARDARADERIEERWMTRSICEDLFIGGGGLVGGIGGATLGGLEGGPIGAFAGGIIGGMSGAADGLQLAGKYCAGYESFDANVLRSTGPFNPGPIFENGSPSAAIVGVRGDWCWTWDPFDPRCPIPPLATPPFVPRPLPLPRPLPFAGSHETASTPAGSLRTTLLQASVNGSVIEQLGPNAFMIHHLPR
jgi:hypothetical protein